MSSSRIVAELVEGDSPVYVGTDDLELLAPGTVSMIRRRFGPDIDIELPDRFIVIRPVELGLSPSAAGYLDSEVWEVTDREAAAVRRALLDQPG